jgi:hypothetical protein
MEPIYQCYVDRVTGTEPLRILYARDTLYGNHVRSWRYTPREWSTHTGRPAAGEMHGKILKAPDQCRFLAGTASLGLYTLQE